MQVSYRRTATSFWLNFSRIVFAFYSSLFIKDFSFFFFFFWYGEIILSFGNFVSVLFYKYRVVSGKFPFDVDIVMDTALLYLCQCPYQRLCIPRFPVLQSAVLGIFSDHYSMNTTWHRILSFLFDIEELPLVSSIVRVLHRPVQKSVDSRLRDRIILSFGNFVRLLFYKRHVVSAKFPFYLEYGLQDSSTVFVFSFLPFQSPCIPFSTRELFSVWRILLE